MWWFDLSTIILKFSLHNIAHKRCCQQLLSTSVSRCMLTPVEKKWSLQHLQQNLSFWRNGKIMSNKSKKWPNDCIGERQSDLECFLLRCKVSTETTKKAINTNSLSKRSLMRSHPVSGNSGSAIRLGIELGAGVGLVEEEEEGIWTAATSAAWTLGSRKQKEGGLTLWMKPCRRPVLSVHRGPESACRVHRMKPVLGLSECITLQLALGCSGGAETHGYELWSSYSILKTNSLKETDTLPVTHRLSSSAAV